MSYLKNRIRAFGFAFAGLRQGLKREKNLQLQAIIAVIVLISGFYFSVSRSEWLIIAGCIALVVSLELMNSAIEKLCDLYSTEQHSKIGYIKDVAAAAVLIAALFAAIAGFMIFYPYIVVIFKS